MQFYAHCTHLVHAVNLFIFYEGDRENRTAILQILSGFTPLPAHLNTITTSNMVYTIDLQVQHFYHKNNTIKNANLLQNGKTYFEAVSVVSARRRCTTYVSNNSLVNTLHSCLAISLSLA